MSLSADDMLGGITLADASGAIGFLLIAAWPLLRGRRALLAGQATCGIAYVIHYALIGAGTGAAMVLLSVAQIAAAWREERRWWGRALYAATFPAMAWLTWSTWAGLGSFCAAAGLTLSTLGRWQRSPAALRILFLLSAFSWAAHDILAGSVQGLLGDLLGAATLAYGLFRDARSRDPASGTAQKLA